MKLYYLALTSLLISMILYSCENEIPGEPEVPVWPEGLVMKVSIIGDSYSTYEGWSNRDMEGNPNNYFVYYPHMGNTDVTSVEKTWWYMLCQKPEFELEISNSYSGSVVSNTHYNGIDVTGTDLSFTNRVGTNSNGIDYNGSPDIILVFGGTNDCWAKVELGDYVHKNWSYADLRCFRPAFSKLLASLKTHYPDAIIYNITNSGTDGVPGLTKSYAKSIQKVCDYYDITNIVLEDIEKTETHPTYAGMQKICEQVYSVLRSTALSVAK